MAFEHLMAYENPKILIVEKDPSNFFMKQPKPNYLLLSEIEMNFSEACQP